jgi:two-component system cell cycle sensor histidine kinase/response regulator CckA
MPQDSITVESSKMTKTMTVPWQGFGLKWKIGTALSALLLALGLFVIGIVYYLTGSALQRQAELRASAIATNLSDAAAGFVSRHSSLELDVLIAKYGRLDGLAYAYIQDSKGNVVATSIQPFPAELKEAQTTDRRSAGSRVTRLRGRPIYDTRAPLLEGQLGTVHVGLWADTIQQGVRDTILPIVGLIAVCLVVGIGISFMIASKAVRPILDLKANADEISRGHLDTPVSVRSNDEVGELARSLERMRASLKAAMVRLSRE